MLPESKWQSQDSSPGFFVSGPGFCKLSRKPGREEKGGSPRLCEEQTLPLLSLIFGGEQTR